MQQSNLGESKADLRAFYRNERSARFAEESWLHILDCAELAGAKIVASYLSYGVEPTTKDIHEKLIDRGATILLPRLLKDKDLEWVQWNGEENSLAAHGNFQEPQGFAFTELASVDVVIVPALHIDRTGNRLGQGGGSYDLALPKISGWKIGLVHHGELTSELLPAEQHDFKLDSAATPDLIVRFPRI